MVLGKCPHCARNVLFLNDICPNCQKVSLSAERSAATPEERTAADEERDRVLIALEASKGQTVNRLLAFAFLIGALILGILTYGIYVQPFAKHVVKVPGPSKEAGSAIGQGTWVGYSLRDHAGLDERLATLDSVRDVSGNMEQGTDRIKLNTIINSESDYLESKLRRQRNLFTYALIGTFVFGGLFIAFAWLGRPSSFRLRDRPRA